MRSPVATDDRSQATVIEPARLIVAEYERLTAKRGATTDADRARLFGLPRYAVWRLRQPKYEPSLRTALYISQKLGVSVGRLWGPASKVDGVTALDEVA